MNRFLKYINILIGLTVVVGAVGAYWVLYRPLPETSGRITAPVSQDAEVLRDERGVPHIKAANDADAFFLQGFVTAQDRMVQMDLARRRAAGRLAEIMGPPLVDSDRETRQLGLERLAERHRRTLHSDERAAFVAYTRGVNFYLETYAGRLPVEFTMAGYEPRPWRVADSILVGLDVFRTLSSDWKTDFLRQSMTTAGNKDKVKALYPVWAPLEEDHPGSNAWVLSGEHTASGKPLLASDPHLPYSAPGFWYQARITGDRLDVSGMTIPGLPGVIIGHNDRIGWASTNLHFDVQDLYAERLDPRTGRYARAGRFAQAAREQDRIVVRGAKPVSVQTWVTDHGPVVVSAGELNLALRWTAAEPGAFRYAYLAINRARNWEEFRAALGTHTGPAQMFVYADAEGNIGYQAAGKMPRRNYDGRFPVDGASGDFEWLGFIPFAELPTRYNPPSGLLVSANENPFPRDYPQPVNGRFAPGLRAKRIRELLAAERKWTAEGMLKVQTDIYDGFLLFLAGQAVAAYEARSVKTTKLDEAVAALKDWDGQMRKEAAAPLIARLLYQHVRTAVAERVTPEAALGYRTEMAPAVIEHLWRTRPQGWFKDYDQAILRSLVDAVEECRRMQGDSIRNWEYGRYNSVRFSTGFLERIPLLGKRLALEPAPMSGSPYSIQQVTPRVGPSMRMVLEPGNWDDSQAVLPLGESAHRFSKHFRDQWETYLSGGAFPMHYQQVSPSARLQILSER